VVRSSRAAKAALFNFRGAPRDGLAPAGSTTSPSLTTFAGAMTITRDPAAGFVTSTDPGVIHETYT
jgi:hypothetical protein